jgi:hypothetical protein
MASVNGKRLANLNDLELNSLMNSTENERNLTLIRKEMVKRGILNSSVLNNDPLASSANNDPLASSFDPLAGPNPPSNPDTAEEEEEEPNWNSYSSNVLQDFLLDPELDDDTAQQIRNIINSRSKKKNLNKPKPAPAPAPEPVSEEEEEEPNWNSYSSNVLQDFLLDPELDDDTATNKKYH